MLSGGNSILKMGFCAESRHDPDILLKNLTSADVKTWFDWIENNFRGSIKSHGTLSVYWRTLKRLYFMKSNKIMDELMVKDCINYMNEVSNRMGLRKHPLPKPTENSLDLLRFQTTNLVYFNLNPDGSPVIPGENKLPHNTEALLSPTRGGSGEAFCDSGYESSHSGYFNDGEDEMLDEICSDGSHHESTSDIDYMSDGSSVVTDDGYLAGDDVTGTILWRHVEFFIVRNPIAGHPNILAAIVSLVHTKGEGRKPRIKRFVIEHEDNPIFDLLAQLLALAWHDEIFAPNFRDIEDIYTHPIPSHRLGMHLKIKRECLDIPIFREPELTPEGYQTSKSIPLKAATWSRYLKRIGEQSGEEKSLSHKVLRRGGINAINSGYESFAEDLQQRSTTKVIEK
ncbi:hypothetical protein BBP40_000208 [Aspergillus hancockii]|nr:hypothetical protein BBP40_000208 [Aspergillus hancockii]